MDLSCKTFVDRVKKKTSTKIIHELNIPKWNPDRLRSHGIEAFINILLGVDEHNLPFKSTEMKMMRETGIEDPILAELVAEFMESSNFVAAEDCLERVEQLHLSEGLDLRLSTDLSLSMQSSIAIAIRNLRNTIIRLEDETYGDGSCDFLCSEVALRLVQIIDRLDFTDIQWLAAKIFSRLSFEKYGDAIIQAVPVLVKVICSDSSYLASEAAGTLARVAFEYSEGIHVSYFQAVRNAFTKFKGRQSLNNFTMFLVCVCRGDGLSSSDKVNVVLPILEDLFSENHFVFLETQLVQACYALSYITYEKCLVLKDQTIKRLMEFTLHALTSLSIAALGVVGNIVRWGSAEQILYLIKDCHLLQCLGEKVLCSQFQKCQMEGCQIIANIAARFEIFIEDMEEASLIGLLCELLEADESDVRMEAAWAIFNMRCSIEYGDVDNYSIKYGHDLGQL